MFEDQDDEWFGADFNRELERLNSMYDNNHYEYMDVDQVELILDHLLIANQFKKARWTAERALDHFPNNNTLLLRKAQAMSLGGDLNAALKILTSLERVEKDNLDLTLTMAASYSQLRDSESAIKYFKRAINIATGDEKIEIYIDLAMEYENLDDFNAAVEILNQALRESRLNEAIIYELAYCYEQLKDYKKAVECFLLYIDEAPYSFTTWYNLGNSYTKMGEIENALWAYDYCTLINEDFAPAFFNMANVYMDDENPAEALKYYKKCLEIDGDDGMVFCSMGECYEELGELERAYDCYQQSTKLLPHLADAWLGKGIISDILGFHPRAIEEILYAVDLESKNVSYWRALANAYENDGQVVKASETYEKGYEIDKNEGELILDWLVFLADIDLNDTIEKIYDVDGLVDKDEAKLVLSYCHWMIGDRTESMLLFDEVVESNVSLSKSLFLHFPTLKEIDYFVKKLEELDNNEEL
jgi:tetratricopeptide (TPR) repeat protein